MQISTHNRSILAMLTELANSGLDGEALTAPEAVVALGERYEFSPPLLAEQADVRALHTLRERLRAALAPAEPEDITTPEEREQRVAAFVNALYRETRSLPELQKHDGWGWHVHAVPNEAALSVRIASDLAVALTDLLVDGELARLGVCAAADCEGLFADLSRNRSKRFCDRGNCANRTHVAAYRARQPG